MNPLKHILIIFIKLYRWFLSPLKTALFGSAGRCRFTPSCSGYALGAISTHGALRGSWLALKRLCRCHPWGDFGPDPVPPVEKPNRKNARIPRSTQGSSATCSAPLATTGRSAR